jgi:ubiquinol-cytochrome c reductase cytochrome c1 subunit
MKKLFAWVLASVVFAPVAFAAGDKFPLERAPSDRFTNVQSLQRGAQMFVNYCLNCHSAQSMRYNRLQDLGLTEAQIKDNLLFTSDKVGDLMISSLSRKDGKAWFGAVPPDLSVIARSRSSHAGSGADWLYTYMRTFYKDDSRPTGWNNLVYKNVGMPHVLFEMQGVQTAKFVMEKDPHDATKTVEKFDKFESVKPGSMNRLEYDNAVADLVGFLVWMGEPDAAKRKQLGVLVMIFLGVLLICAWRLNAVYWKDIH